MYSHGGFRCGPPELDWDEQRVVVVRHTSVQWEMGLVEIEEGNGRLEVQVHYTHRCVGAPVPQPQVVLAVVDTQLTSAELHEEHGEMQDCGSIP